MVFYNFNVKSRLIGKIPSFPPNKYLSYTPQVLSKSLISQNSDETCKSHVLVIHFSLSMRNKIKYQTIFINKHRLIWSNFSKIF